MHIQYQYSSVNMPLVFRRAFPTVGSEILGSILGCNRENVFCQSNYKNSCGLQKTASSANHLKRKAFKGNKLIDNMKEILLHSIFCQEIH